MWKEDLMSHWEIQGAQKRKDCESEIDREEYKVTDSRNTEEVTMKDNPRKKRRLEVSELANKITKVFSVIVDRETPDITAETGKMIAASIGGDKVDPTVDVREGFGQGEESRYFVNKVIEEGIIESDVIRPIVKNLCDQEEMRSKKNNEQKVKGNFNNPQN